MGGLKTKWTNYVFLAGVFQIGACWGFLSVTSHCVQTPAMNTWWLKRRTSSPESSRRGKSKKAGRQRPFCCVTKLSQDRDAGKKLVLFLPPLLLDDLVTKYKPSKYCFVLFNNMQSNLYSTLIICLFVINHNWENLFLFILKDILWIVTSAFTSRCFISYYEMYVFFSLPILYRLITYEDNVKP